MELDCSKPIMLLGRTLLMMNNRILTICKLKLKTRFQMDAIKQILFIVLFIPLLTFGQESKYPKDTIFLKLKDTIFNNPKMKSKSTHNFQGNDGIKFWWNGKWLFYNENQKSDTLCIKHLKNYTFLNLKDIEKKEKQYYNKRFGRNPWIKNKNWVFHTYLLEVISKEKFVVYPVIWRNEGAID